MRHEAVIEVMNDPVAQELLFSSINTQPPRLLLVRGTASIEVVDGVPPEYLEGAKKLMPAQQMQGFEAHVHTTFEHGTDRDRPGVGEGTGLRDAVPGGGD